MKYKLSIFLAVLLTVLCLPGLQSCRSSVSPDVSDPGINVKDNRTFNDYLEDSPVSWGAFAQQSEADRYISSLTAPGLFGFSLNSSKNGYDILPEMAQADPTDVTREIAKDEKWVVPEKTTKGYAFEVQLHPLACWQNGVKIDADTYIYSMQQLLNGENGYEKAKLFTQGDYALQGAADYYNESQNGGGDWSKVGFLKTGEHQITFVFENVISVQLLRYILTESFLVNPDLYQNDKDAYGTSAENYLSCGPYNLVTFVKDKVFVLEKNYDWYGFFRESNTDAYKADTISCSVITDRDTAIKKFASGELDRIVADDGILKEYCDDGNISLTPAQYTSLLSFNGDINALRARQTQGKNKTILAYKDFRAALAMCIDRQKLCDSLESSHTPALGLINPLYVTDTKYGRAYRNFAYAINAVKGVYGESENGFDLTTARELFTAAYDQCLDDRNIRDGDSVYLEISLPSGEASVRAAAAFFINSVAEAVKTTPLEGKLVIEVKEDDNFYESCKNGLTDIIISTVSGDGTKPFEVLRSFCDNAYHCEYGFDSTKELLNVSINGVPSTATFEEWYDMLTVGDYKSASEDVKTQIMAGLEKGLLNLYYVTPLYYHNIAEIYSEKVSVATEVYVHKLGYGGFKYMTFNHSDIEWQKVN